MEQDLIGVKDLLKVHQNKINRVQIDTRIDNEIYLREHPEIEFIIKQYLVKLLEDRPQNVIKYSGQYLHNTNFQDLYEEYLKKEEMAEKSDEEDK